MQARGSEQEAKIAHQQEEVEGQEPRTPVPCVKEKYKLPSKHATVSAQPAGGATSTTRRQWRIATWGGIHVVERAAPLAGRRGRGPRSAAGGGDGCLLLAWLSGCGRATRRKLAGFMSNTSMWAVLAGCTKYKPAKQVLATLS